MPFFVTLASLPPCPWGAKHRFTLPFQMLTDLNTYLNKAIPDTRLTIKKYLDVKFEYLVSGLQPLGRDGRGCGGESPPGDWLCFRTMASCHV